MIMDCQDDNGSLVFSVHLLCWLKCTIWALVLGTRALDLLLSAKSVILPETMNNQKHCAVSHG